MKQCNQEDQDITWKDTIWSVIIGLATLYIIYEMVGVLIG